MVRGDVVSGSTWANGAIQPRASEWLATGDLATQDDSGELRFSGRRGDVIVTAAGLNIYPADLEAALLKQPEVRAAAVVASDSPNGPEPVAVLLADADDPHLRQILEQANRSLADFQQIRRVLRWPEPASRTPPPASSSAASLPTGQPISLPQPPARPSAGRGDVLLQMIATVTG